MGRYGWRPLEKRNREILSRAGADTRNAVDGQLRESPGKSAPTMPCHAAPCEEFRPGLVLRHEELLRHIAPVNSGWSRSTRCDKPTGARAPGTTPAPSTSSTLQTPGLRLINVQPTGLNAGVLRIGGGKLLLKLPELRLLRTAEIGGLKTRRGRRWQLGRRGPAAAAARRGDERADSQQSEQRGSRDPGSHLQHDPAHGSDVTTGCSHQATETV